MKAVFNPSGTMVDKGNLLIRVDLYPDVSCKQYAKHYVDSVDALGNKTGQKQLNPLLCAYLTVPETFKPDDLDSFLEQRLPPSVLKTLDEANQNPHIVAPLMTGRDKITTEAIRTRDLAGLVGDFNQQFSSFQRDCVVNEYGEGITPGSISIGVPSPMSDLASYSYLNYTEIMAGAAHACSGNGTITTINLWLYAATTTIRFGIFFLVSGTTFQVSASTASGVSVSAGSEQQKTGLSLATTAGYFLGCYKTDGRFEAGALTGALHRVNSGEYIDVGDSASFSSAGAQIINLGGVGTDAGGGYIPFPFSESRGARGGLNVLSGGKQ